MITPTITITAALLYLAAFIALVVAAYAFRFFVTPPARHPDEHGWLYICAITCVSLFIGCLWPVILVVWIYTSVRTATAKPAKIKA